MAEQLAGLVDGRRLEMVARRSGIKRGKDSDSVVKLFAAYLRHADQSVLGNVLVELTILLTAAHQQTTRVLNEAAASYKVDTDDVTAKARPEFAGKHKRRLRRKPRQKATCQATGEGCEEGRSGLILSPTGTRAPGLRR